MRRGGLLLAALLLAHVSLGARISGGSSSSGATPSVVVGGSAALPASLNISTEGTIDWFTTGGVNTARGTLANYTHQKKTGEHDIGHTFHFVANGAAGLSIFNSTSTMTVTTTQSDEALPGVTAWNSAGDTGIFTNTNSTGWGFRWSQKATPTQRVLRVYLGVHRATAALACTLPDGTTSSNTITQEAGAGAENYGYFTVTFNASTYGQMLTCSFLITAYNDTGANVKLIAITVASS